MSNEVIEFHFINDSGAEVQLDPDIVGSIAKSLFSICQNMAVMGALGPTASLYTNDESKKVEFRLVSVQRGSLKIAYKKVFKNGAETSVEANFSLKYWAALFLMGLHQGWLQPVIDNPAAIERCREAAPDADKLKGKLADHYDALFSAVLDAGAERVIVLIPSAPDSEVAAENLAPEFFATRRKGEPPMEGIPRVGSLTISGSALRFQDNGKVQEYMLGRFTGDGERVVLIDWKSRRSVPALGERVEVRGTLSRIPEGGSFKALDKLSREHREVSAILTVSGVQIYQ